MTNHNTFRSPEPRGFHFNGNIASLLMTATVILSGFLSLAIFAG